MSRRAAAATAAVLSALALLPAAALACTPMPRSFLVVPQAASSSDQATVVGQGISPGTPVDIVWDGLDGTRLGGATADQSGRFSVPVDVPERAPGAYAIVFVARSASGPSVVGRLPFSVTPAAAAVTPAVADPARSSAWLRDTAAVPRHATDRGLVVGAGLSALAVAVLAGTGGWLLVRRRGAAAAS